MIALAAAVVRPGDTVFEVGGNVGTETVGLADVVGPSGKIITVEPLPSNLQWLELLRDQLAPGQLEIFAGVVSSAVGNVDFVDPPENMSGIGHLAGRAEDRIGEYRSVPSTTLEALAARYGVPAAIFIDAEGAEPSILDGGQRLLFNFDPIIALEANPRALARAGESTSSLRERLDDLGYQCFEIAKFDILPLRAYSSSTADWLAIKERQLPQLASIRRLMRRAMLAPRIFNPMSARQLGRR